MTASEFSAPPEFTCQPLCFNQKYFREALTNQAPIGVFKDAIAGVNQHFDRRFEEGEDIRNLISERSAFVDTLLHYAWHAHQWQSEQISLVAVGGYGRGELHPHSDIDLLILLDDSAQNAFDDKLQQLITFLWDIGLDIGSSVRTISQTVALAKQDITVMTNLQESRTLCGQPSLLSRVLKETTPDKMWSLKTFFKAKFDEQETRHNKHNNTEYNLEPNIKNAPGGLRDIQTINWIAKRYFGVRTLTQLEGQDFFSEKEFAALRQHEAVLWRIRYAIHMISKRADERLQFETQREAAQVLGYQDSDSQLAVEAFMHRYYRSAMAVREINDVLLQYLEEAIFEQETHAVDALNDRFQLRNNHIEMTRPTIFDEFPSALLEVFVLMGNDTTIEGVNAATIRQIRNKAYLIDEKFRQKPENKRLFLALFKIEHGLVTQLTLMKRYGILGNYLPAFGDVIGQMQHDLFHRYTVDAHTLLVIRNMRRFVLPEEAKKFPVAAKVMNNLPKPHLLYIAGLFHDIGKGRGGDHSTLGAVDARQFCEEHGLERSEVNLVTWLVEKHLLMSYISQKQDISDPDVIARFANIVGDQLHLDYLYSLTVADMCGTNPEIWNAWRSSLLRQLYTDTKRLMRLDSEETIDREAIIEESQISAMAQLNDLGFDNNLVNRTWENLGDEFFLRENVTDIVWQTGALCQDSPRSHDIVLIRTSSDPHFASATQIFVSTKDTRNVFLAVATCLANLGLSIQDARIYSANNGYTLDTFQVLDENHKPLKESERVYTKIRTAILEELKLVGTYSEITQKLTPRHLKQLTMPTRTSIHSTKSRLYTILEVISPDRPGLLATIAKIFMEFDIVMLNAKVSTLGERVEDVFYITDTQGQPLDDPDICKQIQHTICEQLDQQVEAENQL